MSQSESPQDELRLLTRQVRAYFDAMRAWGVHHLPSTTGPEPSTPTPVLLGPGEPYPPPPKEIEKVSEASPAFPPTLAQPIPPQPIAEIPGAAEPTQSPLSRLSLAELETLAKDCTQCRLHQGRTHVVFGIGNPHAELMFAGEAPGRDEDRQGEPFVGRAGQLLTRIIEAMGLKRQDVYIANVIKCRPPNNRNPEADEIARCEPYLIRQIELVKPRLIVALGTFAAQTLLQTKLPISQLRGRFHTYQGVKLMPTFHPAFLLRNPERKRAVWEDMQAVQRELRQSPS